MSTPELARRTGRDRKFFYDRFLFLKAFSTDDLDAIATALGITAADIINSARFAAEMHNAKAVAGWLGPTGLAARNVRGPVR